MTRLARWIYRFAATIGFVFLIVTVTPVLRWWTTALSSPWGPDRGDSLVVLGGDMIAPDTMGISTYWRSYYAAFTWRTGHFDRVIVTGRDAAPLMADFLMGHGVPREAVVVEAKADSTRENATYVAKILGPKPGRVVVLTSDYHSGRALREFRRAGVSATALPYPDAYKRINTWAARWPIFLTLSIETAKTVWYRFAN